MTSLPAVPAFINPSGDLQSVVLLLGRLDGKVDQVLLNHRGLDERLRTVESIVVPRVEINAIDGRLDTLEKSHAANRGIMKVLGTIWGAGMIVLGAALSHFWK